MSQPPDANNNSGAHQVDMSGLRDETAARRGAGPKHEPAGHRSSSASSSASGSFGLAGPLEANGNRAPSAGQGQQTCLSAPGPEIGTGLAGRQAQQSAGQSAGKTAPADSGVPHNQRQPPDDTAPVVRRPERTGSVERPNVSPGQVAEQPHPQRKFDQCLKSLARANDSLTSDVGLLHYSREPLKLKDFYTEVRAPMDVEQFAHQAELLLDLSDTSMDGIVEAMLKKVLENDPAGSKLDDIRSAIFIPGSSMLMARTIQGFSPVLECEDRGRRTRTSLKHNQSWLCALCNLAQVSKRHMVIARFKQPINMGENAHQVRLFVLIIVPMIEKATKDQLETGRTFGTMLTDAEFRHRLLRASDETEFKTLMLVKAHQLARAESLTIRHKYRLDPVLHQSISGDALSGFGTNGPASKELQGDWMRASGAPLSAHRADLGSCCYVENPHTKRLFELISASADTECLSADGNSGLKHRAGASGRPTDDKPAGKSAGPSGRPKRWWQHVEFGRGTWQDFSRRLRHYPSDFKDAFVGPPRTLQKSVATIWFLYFGILLPTIAFSSLNTSQTHGHMGDLRKAIIGQAIGGLGFALLGGQPLVIIMTTAPLCLYTKVVHQMCLDHGFHFPAMYAAVGLWNGLFLVVYSLFGFSKLMKWCTRSTEEVFALFIVVAFISDAGKDLHKNFRRFYFTPACEAQSNHTASALTNANRTVLDQSGDNLLFNSNQSAQGADSSGIGHEIEGSVCRRETSLLFVLLMLGTLWLAVTLYKFKRTPYLSAGKREILADYALPTAVILMSLIGATIFDDIYEEKFPPLIDIHFERAHIEQLPWTAILTSMLLGFTLSLLFFMDQNISAAMVDAPQNKLKKGSAYHYDLLIVGILNGCLSLYGLPMMHGVLPHSPLHARSLADIEEQVEEGHLRQVVINSRETRVTSMVAHVLVLGSLFLIPYPIAYIPKAVLNGLFLYMAVTSLDGLQVFERMLLLVTEQSKYPPNHYIRRCPQSKIHAFTLLQLLQLVVMCLFGFSPLNVVEMFFPVIILLMIPFRHKVVPKYIDEKYLDALDGKH